MSSGLKIEEIDKNFVTDSTFDASGLNFYNVLEAPFRVYGLILPSEENKCFLRAPKQVADNTNGGVAELNYHTAGGRVRFRTNSGRIAILATYNHISRMSHFSFSGTAGLDVYVNGEFFRTFIPPKSVEDKFAMVKPFDNTEMKEVQVNFPIYSGIDELIIGLDEGAVVEEGRGYDYDLPIVYYGSSITQGACASRPGNCYTAIIERETNCDYINLGYSGSGRGEPIMAEYIASLNMQMFFLDYDYNATSAEHLLATHEPFFKTVREKHPDLPIIMATKPDYLDHEREERRRVIRRTYDNAIVNGDKNVYFIDGGEIMRKYAGSDGTVEGLHPNDFGFRAMARGFGDVIKRILKEQNK